MGREMKDSGVEWIGEIPKNWEIKKLKNVSEINSGEYISKEDYALQGTFDIIGSNGKIGKINKTNISKKVITTGRVGSIGTCRIVQNAWITDNALIIETKKNILLDYLAYIIPMFPYEIISIGTAQPLITATILKNQYIPYSNLCDQQKIADFLDEKCTELDNVIEKTHASIEEYKKLKQAVITQAVTQGIRDNREMIDSGIEWIGEIPSEWKIIRIKWVLNERKEKSENGGEEPLSMSQKYGIIPTKEMEMIPNMASSFIGAKIVYSGDLVFNKLKAHLGVFAVSQYNGIVSPDYAVYCSKGIADVKYLEYLFKTPQYIAEFKKKSSGVGAGLTRLYTDELYSIYCLLPSWNEQEEIICYLNKKIKEIDNLIEKKEQYLSEIENYKESLIYEYVTGKKEV